MRTITQLLIVPLQLLGTISLVACAPDSLPRKPWREELVVIVVQAESNVDAEFERQMATLFANQLQLKLRLIPLPPDQIMPALLASKAHIAAAGLRSNDSADMRFGPSYQTVREQVVCHEVSPRKMDGLVGKAVAVVAGSAQEAILLNARQALPALHWDARRKHTVAELLVEVATGKLDCTIANEEQLALARNFHPDLDSVFTLAVPSRLAWAFAPDADKELLAEVQKFFLTIKQDGTLLRLLDRYYGHNERLEPVDAVTFITRTRTVLPRFRRLFEEAATLTGIEWKLLAAMGYQESHWNPLATSRTNVRGIMMLTEDTADRMKVSNRLDARQSIMAGARYLQLLKEQMPLRIDEPDRTWLALAAYNQGYGHLEDARVLAKQNGLNPDSWADVKKVMPLLMDPQYYELAKYGQARGGEAVVFVETVRLYHDMLKHLKADEMPPFRMKSDYLPFSFKAQ